VEDMEKVMCEEYTQLRVKCFYSIVCVMTVESQGIVQMIVKRRMLFKKP
jgi:hypothetical protein